MLPFNNKRPIRLSLFAHFYTRDKLVAVVHSLNHTPIYFDKDFLPAIESLQRPKSIDDLELHLGSDSLTPVMEIIERLVEAKLVVPKEYDEHAYLESVCKQVIIGPNFDILFLLLTEGCNLKCTYCFIEGGKPEQYHDSVMTESTAIAAIDAFIRWKAPDGEKSIVFYGGEPLCNKDTFLAALAYIDLKQNQGELAEKTDKILITNGTLLTPDLVTELVRYGVFPYISIDGPPEIHNAQRPYRGITPPKGSFDDAVRGLKLLQVNGIQPGISITVTEAMLPDLHNTLEWLVVNLGVKSVGFNMLEAIPGREYFSDDYGKAFADAILRCQAVCDKYKVYEERVMRKIKQFAKREIYLFDCAACGEQLTVAPDGQVGVCQGFVGTREFFSGMVQDPDYDPRIDPVFIDWSSVSPITNPECFSCPGLGICGGGCPRNPYIAGRGIHGTDGRFCHHVKKTLEWIVFHLYDQLQNKP